MTTFLESAHIAGHVYTPKMGVYLYQNFYNFSVGQKILNNGWYIVSDVDPFMQESNGLYVALYLKFNNGKATNAVVAIRGTVPKNLGNDFEDIYSWYSAAVGTDWHEHLPTYFTRASIFMNNVRKYFDKHFPHLNSLQNLSITGHSLGGALAQLLTLRFGVAYRSVVFNSPGCGEMAGAMAATRWKLINNVNSRYGVINKIGQLIGKLYVIDVPEQEAEAKVMFEHFNQADFEKSLAIDRVAASAGGIVTPIGTALEAVGMGYRVASVTGSTVALAETSEAHQQFVQCEEQTVFEAWQGPSTIIKNTAACGVSTLWNTYGKVIAAQHNIDNMVKVLAELQYRKIANLRI